MQSFLNPLVPVCCAGTANVQAAKVVRSKRQVERPADELALGAGVQTTAAGQGVLQPHQLLAFQRQYLATQSQQGTPPNSLLLQDWQMQAMQHAAVAANIATQSAAGNDAAAASGGTAGKKRRGRPSNAEKSSAAAATAAAHSKRARNAGRCVVICKHGMPIARFLLHGDCIVTPWLPVMSQPASFALIVVQALARCL